ncbi:MAG: hypothetical protein DRN01_06540, partial [Thermoplasmata archaeon]
MVNLSYIDRSKKARQVTLDIQNKTLVSIPSATSNTLVYLSGANGVYIAVGVGGTIVEYNGSLDEFELHSQSGVITTNQLSYIDISLGNGVTVGAKFTVLNYDVSTDTFSAHASNGYDTDVDLYISSAVYSAYGILYDIFAGEDTSSGNGVIYNYDGSSTTKVFETTKGKIMSLATLDFVNYIAVGYGGGIYKSSDYGHTWTEIDTGVVDNFNDISGIKSSEFWIATTSGKVYKFNSDTNELTLYTDYDVFLSRVWMLDVNDGYIIGSSGTLLHYDGDSWSVIPTGTMIGFNSIYGLEHNKFYIACSGGYIFRFYNMAYPSLLLNSQGNIVGTYSNPLYVNNISEATEIGIATSSTATTLVDTSKDWENDVWLGDIVIIIAGTGKGQVRTISSNTSDTLTVSSAWTTNPDTTSEYIILTSATVEAISEVNKTTSQELTSQSIAASSSQNVDSTIPAGKSGAAVTLKTAYDAAATSGATINVFYSPDGTHYDTDTDDSYIHPFTAGSTIQKTYIVPAIHPFIRIQVVNNDSSKSITADLWTTF